MPLQPTQPRARPRPARRAAAAALLVLTLATAPAALHADPPEPAAALQQLGSRDYTEREAATRALLADDAVTLDWVADAYRQADSPEQRHRLMDIARHHAVRAMRERDFPNAGPPAIGFSHEVLAPGNGPDPGSTAVHIVATLPGFPGHAHFRPGDLITAVAGEPLGEEFSPDGFKDALRRYEAGDTIEVTILRDGEPRTLTLRLASMEALGRIYGDDPVLRGAYQTQWLATQARLLASAPPTPVLRVEPANADD